MNDNNNNKSDDDTTTNNNSYNNDNNKSNDDTNIGIQDNRRISSAAKVSIFFKWAIHGLFLFYFRLFNTIQLTINKCSMKICRCLDSNRGPLVLEATALPTEPQPLPKRRKCWESFFSVDIWHSLVRCQKTCTLGKTLFWILITQLVVKLHF